MKKVSIIILNWNQPKLTLECLESIQKLKVNKYKLEIIVVDNASTDDSVEKLSNYKLESVDYELLINESNMGFAEGNNIGIRRASRNGADYFFILNNDTDLDRNIIVELIKAARKYPEAAIFSPKIYFAKGYEFHKDRYKRDDLEKVIWAAGGDLDTGNVYGTNHGVDEVDSGQFDKSCLTDFASGAAMFIRASATQSMEIFNPKYFMYLEDLEFAQRIKNKGWDIRYVPNAILWHKVSQSSAIGGRLNDYFTTRNRMSFGMKYMGIRAKFALLRESIRLFLSGREWQKKGIKDYYIGRFGKGSWR